jgi:hypothetical protein
MRLFYMVYVYRFTLLFHILFIPFIEKFYIHTFTCIFEVDRSKFSPISKALHFTEENMFLCF